MDAERLDARLLAVRMLRLLRAIHWDLSGVGIKHENPRSV